MVLIHQIVARRKIIDMSMLFLSLIFVSLSSVFLIKGLNGLKKRVVTVTYFPKPIRLEGERARNYSIFLIVVACFIFAIYLTLVGLYIWSKM